MTALPPLRFTGATVLCDGEMQRRPLSIAEGMIADGRFPDVDLSGYVILPGIIDLHGDAFERHISPRPRTDMPLKNALASAARDAAAHGVTTAWFAQCWSWEGGQRSPDAAETLLASLKDYAAQAPIDIHAQLRCETHMVEGRERLVAAIETYGVGYVVFNNHLNEAIEVAKKDPLAFANWAMRSGRSSEEFIQILREAKDRGPEVPRHLCALAQSFDALGVTYGSHDDRDAETREKYRTLGAHIAEFPLTEKAAAAAKAMGGPVIMGAPNVLRGGSQSGNVSAQKLIALGLCDVLVSDYHYPALPAAIWVLVDRGICTLPEAWDMVSAAPAQIMGLKDRGTLEIGKRADAVILNAATRSIEATLSRGRVAHMSGDIVNRLMQCGQEMSLAAE